MALSVTRGLAAVGHFFERLWARVEPYPSLYALAGPAIAAIGVPALVGRVLNIVHATPHWSALLGSILTLVATAVFLRFRVAQPGLIVGPTGGQTVQYTRLIPSRFWRSMIWLAATIVSCSLLVFAGYRAFLRATGEAAPKSVVKVYKLTGETTADREEILVGLRAIEEQLPGYKIISIDEDLGSPLTSTETYQRMPDDEIWIRGRVEPLGTTSERPKVRLIAHWRDTYSGQALESTKTSTLHAGGPLEFTASLSDVVSCTIESIVASEQQKKDPLQAAQTYRHLLNSPCVQREVLTRETLETNAALSEVAAGMTDGPLDYLVKRAQAEPNDCLVQSDTFLALTRNLRNWQRVNEAKSIAAKITKVCLNEPLSDTPGARVFRAQSLSTIGIFLAEVGQVADAQALAARADSIAPNDAIVANNVGTLFASLGDLSKAAVLWQRSLESRPMAPVALTNLAVAQAADGSNWQALGSVTKALLISPDDSSARMVRAYVFLNLTETGRIGPMFLSSQLRSLARHDADRAIALAPENLHTSLTLGNVLIKQGQHRAARELAERINRQGFPWAKFLCLEGRAEAALGNKEAARRAYTACLQAAKFSKDGKRHFGIPANFRNRFLSLTSLSEDEEKEIGLRILDLSIPKRRAK